MNCDLITESSTGRRKILYQRLAMYNKVIAEYQGTWCELFGTTSYKRLKVTEEKLKANIVNHLNSIYNTSVYVEFRGSRRMTDVFAKRKQEFLVVKKEV